MTEITPPTQSSLHKAETRDWHSTFAPTFWENVTMGYLNGARRQLHRHTCLVANKDVEVILDSTRSLVPDTIFMATGAAVYLLSTDPADSQVCIIDTLEEGIRKQHVVTLQGTTPVRIGDGLINHVYFVIVAFGGINQGFITASPVFGAPVPQTDVILATVLPGYGFGSGSGMIVADNFAIAIPQITLSASNVIPGETSILVRAYNRPGDLENFVVAQEWRVTGDMDNVFTLPFFLKERDAVYFAVTVAANNTTISADFSYADLDGTAPLDTAGAGFLFQGSP